MKLISIIVLSTFSIVGMYIGGYSWLYTQKVKEAQYETSIQTPKKLIQLLHTVIISAFLLSGVSLFFLIIELLQE